MCAPLARRRGKEQALLAEAAHGGRRRAAAAEGGEERAQCLLHLAVGVEHDVSGGVVDEAHGEPHLKLAAGSLGALTAEQAGAQDVQLGLAHRALQPKQQAIVEVGRVVEAVLVEDQRVRERADLEQAVPVGRAAGEARDLEAEHHPDLAEAHGGDQLLEAFAVRVGAGETLVAVDDHDAFARPAEGHGALAQGVLALRALRVLEDLPERALAHVEVGQSLEVARVHLVVLFAIHAAHLLPLQRAMPASSRTSSALPALAARASRAPEAAATAGCARTCGGQAHIQLARPPRSKTAAPRGRRPGACPVACARRAS